MAAITGVTWYLFALVEISCIINFVLTGQADPSVCTPNANVTGEVLPSLSDSYMTRMEYKIISSNKWIYIDEYFDGPGNRAAMKVIGYYDPGKAMTFISDYNTSEYFIIKDGKCEVTALSDDIFKLPFHTVNGTEHLLGAQDALMFGRKYKENYLHQTTIRNITVNHWESCVYLNATKKTMRIDFYFSDPNSWHPPSGSAMVPVRSTILSKEGTGTETFEQYEEYDYVYFKESIDDYSVFLVPEGMYCKGRKTTKPTPSIPRYFSFRAEMIVPTLKVIGAYDEWYDFDTKIVRIDSKPMPGGIVVVPMKPRREITDFLSGVSYLIDMETGVCHVVPISPDVFDSKLLDPNHVAIKSPQEFFNFDSANFTYSGQRMDRGVPLDSWIGLRNGFPPGFSQTSIWEWYFTTPDWTVSQFGPTIRNAQVPMRLKITIPSRNLTFLYNIFDFSEEEPDYTVFNVAYCYEKSEIRHFRFSIKGNGWAVSPLPKNFKYKTALQLASVMGVSLLRINGLEVDFDSNGVDVVFTLLGPPPVKGDAINGTASPTSERATFLLRTSLETGKFYFTSSIKKPTSGWHTYTFLGVSHSMKEVIRTDNGSIIDIHDTTTGPGVSTIPRHPSPTAFKTQPFVVPTKKTTTLKVPGFTQMSTLQSGWQGGAVAGIAIGMVILGLLLGVISTFFTLKFRKSQYDIMDTKLTMNEMSTISS